MRLSVDKGEELFKLLRGKSLTAYTHDEYIVFHIEQERVLNERIQYLKSKRRNKKGLKL